MFGLGVGELILILSIAILLFGSKKIPELAKGMGVAINEFKKAKNSEHLSEKSVDEKNE
jgi:TatA/E family protein of Tat protein translocase